MYISDLALQGFKSFAHRTDVSFDQGITAIVGPNGCGKSNIVDALRWVLGEQRPTLLRSSSMSNVIFNGTAKKNELSMAEVSLTFINNKGLLPTEYSEVTITRRLFRSGDSEYLINDTKCRLKDIMGLFMDTGMSSDAYSVIELKMVEEILTNKNNDRRRLFEEAAGVTSYKDKRKKTLRKLDSTHEDLQRVEDLVVEIRKKVKSLERQAKKAQKAKAYQKELTQLDKALSKHKYQNIQEELAPLKKRITNADKEKKEILSKIESLETSEENGRQQLNEKERREADAQRKVSQLSSTLRESETQLKITKEKISNEKGVVEQYTSDIDQAEQDLTELRGLFEQNAKELDQFQGELEKARGNLEDAKSSYSSVQQTYREEREGLNEVEAELEETNRQLSQLQTQRIKVESQLENTNDDIKRITEERQTLKQNIGNLQDKKETLITKTDEAHEKQNQKEKELKQARKKRELLGQQENELKDTIRKLESRLDSLKSEINLLQDIANSNEAYPGSVKYLTEQQAGSFPTMKVVSDIFSTDEEHAVALEAVLGQALNYIVVDTLEDAQRAAEKLKQDQKGQAVFIPLQQLSEDYEMHQQALAHQVETPNKFNKLKQLLLGQVVIYGSVDKAYENANDGLTGVTKAGEVVTGHQFLQSGSTQKNAGMRVGLKDKIKKLKANVTSVSKRIKNKRNELKNVKGSYDKINVAKLEQALNDCRKKVRSQEDALNSCKSKTQVYRSNNEELKTRAESLEATKEDAGETLQDLTPQKKDIEEHIGTLKNQQSAKKQAINELEEKRSIVQSRFNDARLKHQNLENKVENHERDIRRAEEGIKSLKQRLAARGEKKEEAKKRIQRYKSQISKLEDTLEDAREKKKKADGKLEDARTSSAKQRGKINQLEKDLKEIRRQKEVNMELVHHLSMAKEKFEMQAGNISDHVWETYETLMDQVEAVLPEHKEPDEAKERIGWLRKKLNRIGEVNALAVEEFEKEKERLDFFDEQMEDLEKARTELVETIEEINKTATKRFNKTFKKIRANFKDVFHTLFNEDDFCDLTIDQEAEDPLEAKIEIEANPRGKRPSTINQLSGGEKTLTAIALLFAIYLVKPSPFCVLDEVDAPLDDANIERFANMIQRFSKETQFIIITHNKKTMVKAEMMYGVTMPETGISRLVGVEMDEVMQA